MDNYILHPLIDDFEQLSQFHYYDRTNEGVNLMLDANSKYSSIQLTEVVGNGPNKYPPPRGLRAHASTCVSGSDHNKS